MSNKTSDKNIANVTKNDIDILNALIYVYEARLPNYNELMDSEVSAIKNILSDYTMQKQINEEHKKINGELMEQVKELDTKNNELLKDLYNAHCIISDLSNKVKELEEENKENKKKYLALLIGQFPDTTETYKKYKKELQKLLQESEDK